MISLLLSLLLGLTSMGQETAFDIRARDILILGKGAQSGTTYYDVVITRQPAQGVLIKLPYTRKGGKFTFDLHHRIAMTNDFDGPADVMPLVEVVHGVTTSLV